VVGSKGFTEQYILSELLTNELEAAGAVVGKRPNMGSTILFDALRSDTVHVSVDYTGTIWAAIMKRPQPIGRTEMLAQVTTWLESEHKVSAMGPLGFENAYALAMRRDRAASLEITSLADVGRVARGLTIAGDPEFFGRPEWTRVRGIYGLEAIRTRGMDSTFMYGAVRDGEVDLITAYTTDGRIDAFDLAVLADPEQAFPPYDAVLLLSPGAARDRELGQTLESLVNAIPNHLMRSANRDVDLDGLSIEEAARRLRDRIVSRDR
jgi:osmoprotectant transport system permease protein